MGDVNITDSARQATSNLDGSAPPNGRSGTPEQTEGDLQEHRAYLQRGETRLSTLHRVGGAFLSGAGLLTLLPVLGSATFPTLFSQVIFLNSLGFPAPGSLERWLAVGPVIVSLALPLIALIALIRDLIAFYFTAYHFEDSTSTVVYPRFILSGIKVSESSLSDDGRMRLKEARRRRVTRELLIPGKKSSRRRLLQEARAVSELNSLDLDNVEEGYAAEQLQNFVYRYTASHVRPLEQESAKMEASLARHHMFLRVLVLRYAKAFLLTILTTILTVSALATTNLASPDMQQELIGPSGSWPIGGDLLWVGLLGMYGAWCFLAAFVVRRPIEWIYRDTTNTTSPRTPVSLARFENQTLRSAEAMSLLIAGLLVWFAIHSDSVGIYWAAGLIAALSVGATLFYARYARREERRTPLFGGGQDD